MRLKCSVCGGYLKCTDLLNGSYECDICSVHFYSSYVCNCNEDCDFLKCKYWNVCFKRIESIMHKVK